MSNRLKVAPRDRIVRDFEELDARTTLAATWDMERTLLEVTVASRAHEGHGAFNGTRYVDTTEAHVARALGRDSDAEAAIRQRWIAEVSEYADAAIAGHAPRFAVTPHGMPLCGVGLLRWIEVEPSDVLKGLVIGGLRDRASWRRKAHERYGIPMGYGQIHAVNLDRMAEAGLDGEALARQPHEDDLDALRRDGVIVDEARNGPAGVLPMYVRYQTGPGASDDAAILAAGRLHGIGAAVGCFLADALDTLEKYTVPCLDQDFRLATRIRERMPDLDVSDEEVVRLTGLASTPPEMRDTLPDSPVRALLQRDRQLDQCILESHFLWIMERPRKPMSMGRHPTLDSEALYAYIDERIASTPPAER